jgi:hypothetical protein
MSVVDKSPTESVSTENTTVRYLAATLAFTSQVIHLWILPETFVVTLLPGLFFLFVGIVQGLLGISLLFGSSRWTLHLGIPFNLLIVALWIITRVVSLPVITGVAQSPVGLLGIGATVAEITLVVLLLKLLTNKK